MSIELPEFYFRIRENGALVFRVGTDERNRRIEMDQVAVVNIKNGQIKGHGGNPVPDDAMDAIEEWRDARLAEIATREVDDILRTVDHLNLTTQWAQSKATEDQLEAVTDRLLLAMHDLRSLLVRKKAEKLIGDRKAAE